MDVEVLVAGNYCHDRLVTRAADGSRAETEALGGSAAYATSVLRALGARFRVVAKVGADFRSGYLDRVPSPIVVPGARTTSFVDDYTLGEERVATLLAACEPIRPGELGAGSAEVAIACPIAGELPPETLLALRSRARVLVADIQGLIRRADADGRVTHARWDKTPFAALADRIDYLKIGSGEADGLDLAALSRRTHVILTRDARGCTLIREGRATDVPAFPATEVDRTGAGDCFLAAFSCALARGRAPEDAAVIGCWAGALAVSRLGIPDLSPEDFAPHHQCGWRGVVP
jgi:1D-myo-inositol 3-kinase